MAPAAKNIEKDILKLIPPPAEKPKLTARRIGIHTSTSGGVETAAERAYRLGCNALQVFSSSPRQWKPYDLAPTQCDTMSELRAKYDLKPLVIHANYLINVAGVNSDLHQKSVAAFRSEVERGLALCADYLVLHPGSWRGDTREAGLQRAAEALREATDGLDLESAKFTVLIENTAGAEFSCHTHVAGYDIVSNDGYDATMKQLDDTVGLKNVAVWHCNDAKAACGSKLDRHQHIGEGTIGIKTFQRLLNDPRTEHAAFLAETPIDEPLDDLRNVNALKACVDPTSVLKMPPAPRSASSKPKAAAKKAASTAPASKSSRR